MKLPCDFKRTFCPVEEFGKWKASEKQVLFHHAGLPILKSLLPAEHLIYHHSLLVTGIRILCENEVTNLDIDIADTMLESYTHLLPTLYDERECTLYNSHSLTHFPDQVILFLNQCLSHGWRGISDPICQKLGTIQHSQPEYPQRISFKEMMELWNLLRMCSVPLPTLQS